MSNLIAGSLNGVFPSLQKNRLEIISLLFNNVCNLTCRHCYLQAPQYDDYLTHSEWLKLLSSIFIKLKPSILCFAGKEVFADSQSVSVLLKAAGLRNTLQFDDSRKTQIGVITNGTLLHKYQYQIEKAIIENTAPDYFDVSIDGLISKHNYIRGEKAFEKLLPNLFWLLNTFKEKVWITYTLNAYNLHTLPDFIQVCCNEFNTGRFSIGLYKNFEYTDQGLNMNLQHLTTIPKRLFPALEKIKLTRPAQVIMEIDHTQDDLLRLLTWTNFIKDEKKSFASYTHEFENGLTLRLDVARVPVGLIRSARITPEGYLLSAKDLMRVKEYDKVVVAKARECNFDAEAMYETGL